ncbi:MAG: hypothetical protein IPN68_03455 [Bacteroidetes bacterium]|nr:hypothetical protein [Bacteroidota bacterium]
MKKITSIIELKDAIHSLEDKQHIQGQLLKEHFLMFLDLIKPVNIIKNTFREVASEPDLMSNILRTTIGLTVGYISNKTIAGSSHNLFRKLLGIIMQFSTTSLIIRNPEVIKSFGQSLLDLFSGRNETKS